MVLPVMKPSFWRENVHCSRKMISGKRFVSLRHCDPGVAISTWMTLIVTLMAVVIVVFLPGYILILQDTRDDKSKYIHKTSIQYAKPVHIIYSIYKCSK